MKCVTEGRREGGMKVGRIRKMDERLMNKAGGGVGAGACSPFQTPPPPFLLSVEIE